MMGTVRKTITLTDAQDAWIQAQIEAGHYASVSECIGELIRREREREAEIEIEMVRAALIDGEASGDARPFDAEAFKQNCARPHRA